MKTHRLLFVGLIAAVVFLSGCATSPPSAPTGHPSPIYDEQGRPLWVPLPEGRPPLSDREETPSGRIPSDGTDETDIDQPNRIPPPPPRIGSDIPSEPAGSDDHLIAAVSSLEVQAEHELETGQIDRAFTTAERAIRIDPKNAKLWNLLARIQLERSNFIQAEQLSRKSNLLSRDDRALQAENWRIISKALDQRGEKAEAKKALRKAWELE